MSMNISGLGNSYNGVNTNSKQYKALEKNGWLSGVIQNEAMMLSLKHISEPTRRTPLSYSDRC